MNASPPSAVSLPPEHPSFTVESVKYIEHRRNRLTHTHPLCSPVESLLAPCALPPAGRPSKNDYYLGSFHTIHSRRSSWKNWFSAKHADGQHQQERDHHPRPRLPPFGEIGANNVSGPAQFQMRAHQGLSSHLCAHPIYFRRSRNCKHGKS